jgi:hypothetical protein
MFEARGRNDYHPLGEPHWDPLWDPLKGPLGDPMENPPGDPQGPRVDHLVRVWVGSGMFQRHSGQKLSRFSALLGYSQAPPTPKPSPTRPYQDP